MTRQLDIEAETRESKRQSTLIRALEYGIVGALRAQGFDFLGYALNYDEYSCGLVAKASVNGKRVVAFIYSDTMINCIIRLDRDASRGALRWGADKYHLDEV